MAATTRTTKQDNNSERTAHLFCTFAGRPCTTMSPKCWISRFMVDETIPRQNFLILCDVGSGSWEFNSGRVRLLLASKGAGVMAMKIERKRIHFLSVVFASFAVPRTQGPHYVSQNAAFPYISVFPYCPEKDQSISWQWRRVQRWGFL